MAEPPPLLDLDTLITRPRVVIDNEAYEIVSPDELSILDHHRLGRWGRRLEELMGKAEIDEFEQAELTSLLVKLTDRIMVGVPAPVREKLKDGHRLSVAEVFTRLPLQQAIAKAAAALAAEENPEEKPTGAKRSPALQGSTAAIPDGGSAKPPSPSSAPTSP